MPNLDFKSWTDSIIRISQYFGNKILLFWQNKRIHLSKNGSQFNNVSDTKRGEKEFWHVSLT